MKLRLGTAFIALALALAATMAAVAQTTPTPDRRLGLAVANYLTPPEILGQTGVAADVGLGAVRIALDWNRVQPQPGAFDWSAYDELVRRAQVRGVEVVFTFGPTAAWASSGAPTEPLEDKIVKLPRNWADWQNYVREAVTHFRGKVRYWQIWEGFDFPNFRTTESQIAILASNTYGVAKAVDPNSRLILPEPGGIDLGWIAGLRGTPLWGNFDILGLRPYHQEPARYLLALSVLRAEILAGTNKPVWIVGWAKGLNPTPPPVTPAGLGQLAQSAFTCGVERLFSDVIMAIPAPSPQEAQTACDRAGALAQLPPLAPTTQVALDLNSPPAEKGLYNLRYRNWPGGVVFEEVVCGRRAVRSDMEQSPLTLETRNRDNPWFYFDVDDRFLFATQGRTPLAVTVDVLGAGAVGAAGFNIYYDAGPRFRFSKWQPVDVGPGQWFTYRIVLPDAWLANKGGYDFRINAKGSKEDIYISQVVVEPLTGTTATGPGPLAVTPVCPVR